MDEDETAAALHHPVRRHRGIDAAGDERHQPPAGAHRKAAGTRHLVQAHECARRQDLHRHRQLRLGEVHSRARPGLHQCTQLPVDVVGGERKAFVHAPGLHPEGVEGLILQGFQNVCRQGRHVGVGALHRGEIGDAEHPAEPVGHFLRRHVVVEVQQQSRRGVADLLESQSPEGRAQVSFEVLDEVGAVAFLEGDLVVSNQGRAHGGKIADSRNFCMESRV